MMDNRTTVLKLMGSIGRFAGNPDYSELSVLRSALASGIITASECLAIIEEYQCEFASSDDVNWNDLRLKCTQS